MMNQVVRGVGLLFLVLALSACSGGGAKKDGADGGEVAGSGSSPSVSETGGASTQGARGGTRFHGRPINNPDSPLYTKTVYFEFDKSEIQPAYVDTLRAHADYLAANRYERVLIEGHCDERGSREYNIGLGERRAAAVKGFLLSEGVSAAQVETQSFGEEKPAKLGHDESAWSLNRRAEIVYQ
jgi:peptidoglycan-associated lipoprotein